MEESAEVPLKTQASYVNETARSVDYDYIGISSYDCFKYSHKTITL